jgi:hypothetical protein
VKEDYQPKGVNAELERGIKANKQPLEVYFECMKKYVSSGTHFDGSRHAGTYHYAHNSKLLMYAKMRVLGTNLMVVGTMLPICT